MSEHAHLAFRWSDPYGRELDEVRRQRKVADRVVELLEEADDLGRHLTPGREAGERLFKRLEASRLALARIAERDAQIAAELERRDRDPYAWEDERKQRGTRLKC